MTAVPSQRMEEDPGDLDLGLGGLPGGGGGGGALPLNGWRVPGKLGTSARTHAWTDAPSWSRSVREPWACTS